MFDSAKLMYSTGGAGFYDHPIEQSLRFNTNDNPQLLQTFASAGNQKTWTMSMWVKIHSPSQEDKVIWGCQTNTYTSEWMRIIQKGSSISWESVTYPDETLRIYLYTDQVFRDPSAWYHLVFKYDSTQATASDRAEIYVNGVAATYNNASSSPTYPSQNYDGFINNGSYPHSLGGVHGYGMVNHMSLAEVHFIDGTALDASSFGETKSGVWIPKAYSGSYGTNGFYLDFDGTYYNDKSGNGNNFTANNLAATDVVLDSPTNNFATWNGVNTNGTLAQGNLQVSTTDNRSSLSSFSMPTGKWYWEVRAVTSSGCHIGIGEDTLTVSNSGINQTAFKSVTYAADGRYYKNGSQVGTVSSYTSGDIISISFDASTREAKLYKNNSLQITITLDSVSSAYAPATGSSGSPTVIGNFGQDSSFAGNETAQGNTDANGYGDFYYAPPTGYLALCTANLPDPVASIDPAQDGSPQDHFNTVPYIGNSSTQSITGVGFQPDLVWTKQRNGAGGHVLVDVIRGSTARLFSYLTNAESVSATHITSFDSDGFTASTDSFVNASGNSYVAWSWKANGSGVSNTDGSETSTVSANTDAGFSVVKWTSGGNVGVRTVGHGLGATPKCIITKNLDNTSNWVSWNIGLPNNDHEIYLNSTSASVDPGFSVWSQSTTTFGLRQNRLAANGDECIAYVWAEVDGFSKFGSYTGNGSSDGPFVYTGFRPAFVMIKRTDSSEDWFMWDDKRLGYNGGQSRLKPHSTTSEYPANLIEMYSNGFKHRASDAGINLNGSTYIYMAFAENPFKYANAR